MMLDLDHFKRINDSFGHANGDMVLIEFYRTCQQLVRESDTITRYGGEEFLVLLPETQLHQAVDLAERIREAVAEIELEANGGIIRLTVSIGVVEWDAERFKTIEDMLECADEALYNAKNNGRNQVASI